MKLMTIQSQQFFAAVSVTHGQSNVEMDLETTGNFANVTLTVSYWQYDHNLW
jgi:hypothetical protein